ncbi:MAG: hypothetical protein LIR47_00760 [Spirochaetota bacterium]|nr:hypothetical protein [Spirochaetota bacterium]
MARRTALLTLLIVIMVPLFGVGEAGPIFRIGLVLLDENLEGLAEVVSTSAGTYGSSIYLDARQQQVLLEKEKKSLEQKRLDAIHAAYGKQDADILNTALRVEQQELGDVPNIRTCEYTIEAYDEALAALVRSDEQALVWFMQHSLYDGLFLIQSEKLGDLQRIRIEFVSTDRILLLDRLVQYGSYQSLGSELDEQIFRLFAAPDQGALLFEKGIGAFSVFVDGAKEAVADSPIFLDSGAHELLISAEGYETSLLSVVLEPKKIKVLSFSLEKIKHPVLQINSTSGKANWFVDGRQAGIGLSISLADPSYPLVLTGTKDGFANRIIQLDTPVKKLEVAFQPVLLSDEVLVLESQKDFYKRLRNTILLFGAYVGCTALSKTFNSTEPLWQVGLVATSSLALVSGVALVMELASYAARSGSSF